jgi:hypothetical protein
MAVLQVDVRDAIVMWDSHGLTKRSSHNFGTCTQAEVIDGLSFQVANTSQGNEEVGAAKNVSTPGTAAKLQDMQERLAQWKARQEK